MGRIPPIESNQSADLQAIFAAGEKLMGFVPNDGLIMAHQPAILKAFLALVQSVYAAGEVSGGLKRLIGLLSSNAAGCRYCQAHAAYAAHQQGESEERIKAVWNFRSSPLFSDAERAALEVAIKSGMVPNQVEDEDFEQLKKYYSEKQMVEIMSVIAMYGFLNRWNSTLNTNLEEQPKSYFAQLSKETK